MRSGDARDVLSRGGSVKILLVGAEKDRLKLIEFLEDGHFDADEAVEGLIPLMQTEILQPQALFGVAVTTRRVLVVEWVIKKLQLRTVPVAVASVAPRDEITVEEYKPPSRLWGQVALDRIGHQWIALYVHRKYREDTDRVVQLLAP